MTTFNHTPYALGMNATSANFNAALEQLDEAIGLHNRTATTDPGASNDSSQGYAAGRSIWLNTVSDTVFICVTDTVGAAVWQDVASGATIDMDDITTGTLALANGGTNTNLGSTGPGWWRQNSSGAGVSVRELQASDMPSLVSRLSVGGADAFTSSNLLDAVARSQIKLNGTTIGARRGINLIPVVGASATVSLTVTDSAPDEHVNVQIAVSGAAVGTDELVKVGLSGTPNYMSPNQFVSTSGGVTLATGFVYQSLVDTLRTTGTGPDGAGGVSASLSAIPANIVSGLNQLRIRGWIQRNDYDQTGSSNLYMRLDNNSSAVYRRNLVYNNGSTLSVLADGSNQTSFVVGTVVDDPSFIRTLIDIEITNQNGNIMIRSSLHHPGISSAVPTSYIGSCRYEGTTSPTSVTFFTDAGYYFTCSLRAYNCYFSDLV